MREFQNGVVYIHGISDNPNIVNKAIKKKPQIGQHHSALQAEALNLFTISSSKDNAYFTTSKMYCFNCH